MGLRSRDRAGHPGARTLPVLPLRDLVVFPHVVVPLVVGRPASRAALARAWHGERELLLVAQRSADVESPAGEDLHAVGTVARVLQMIGLPDENLKVLVEGRERARVLRLDARDDHLVAEVEPFAGPERPAAGPDLEALLRAVRDAFRRYVRLRPGLPQDIAEEARRIEDPGRLADVVAGYVTLSLASRQELLETADPVERLERVLRLLHGEIEVLSLERKIHRRVRQQLDGEAGRGPGAGLRAELGERDEGARELDELEKRAREGPLTEAARERVLSELRKLRMMNPMSAEAAVLRNYVDWVLALPWTRVEEEDLDIARAAAILDEDHHGLREVKDRILEHLAVSRRVGTMQGPILCFVGPPGVGKTSLGRSIARATGRRFVRQALGGVRDEAEIRGHRRTYIGAFPGKIIQGLRRAGTSNPVFLLDEVDKMSSDWRGEPASALLEVLDPEQNHAFVDHYLDLDYDLGRVMFICTANTLQGIPEPLRDRLEIIHLPGYTEREKLVIARRYLIPRQLEAHGIGADHLAVTRQAVERIVREYTREAGVRELERQIARICRKVARRVVERGEEVRIRVTGGNVHRLLGVPRFGRRARDDRDQVGLVRGLAVTPWGGEVLDIEVAVLPGKGELILTGRLGDWLKESATAGFSYVRSRAEALGLDPAFHERSDVHVHYPGNSLRTDGPSAGIAMATALASALTGIPVRRDVAMTGEVTLRGRVLPVGGLKEKLLAAVREGVQVVLVPAANERDLGEVPEHARENLEIHLVEHMDEVLARALVRRPAPAPLTPPEPGG